MRLQPRHGKLERVVQRLERSRLHLALHRDVEHDGLLAAALGLLQRAPHDRVLRHVVRFANVRAKKVRLRQPEDVASRVLLARGEAARAGPRVRQGELELVQEDGAGDAHKHLRHKAAHALDDAPHALANVKAVVGGVRPSARVAVRLAQDPEDGGGDRQVGGAADAVARGNARQRRPHDGLVLPREVRHHVLLQPGGPRRMQVQQPQLLAQVLLLHARVGVVVWVSGN